MDRPFFIAYWRVWKVPPLGTPLYDKLPWGEKESDPRCRRLKESIAQAAEEAYDTTSVRLPYPPVCFACLFLAATTSRGRALDKEKTCCFTGHRPDKLPWGEKESDPRCRRL